MSTGNTSGKNIDGFQKSLSLISKAKNEDAVKRKRLELLLSETAVCLNGMEQNIFSIINGDFLDVQKTIEERIKRLQQMDYYILVAGETSSGKSSLINLMLGVDLLPSSVLSTTSTICELKYGKRPALVVHFTKRSGKPPLPPKSVKLLEPDTCDKSYREQIAPYVNIKDEKRENELIYEKVEIFWPHELLQVGVVIIDSPGVGESEKMDQILMSYLPKAFAFIYVISSTNAGGIQKDRLVKILDKVRCLESDVIDSNGLADCALFVINKWDQVPENERNEVKRHIVGKLTKFWPDGNPCEQTVYISTTDALEKQKCGELTEEFDVLVEGVNSMVLKAINSRLTNHWAWANNVLHRIVYRVEGFNKSMLEDRESLVERMNTLFGQIQVLKDERKEDIAELAAKLEIQREKLITMLFDYLKSPEFNRKFTSWEACDIPTEMDTWKLTKIRMKKALKQRFERLLTEWEEENCVHAKIHDELVQCFIERFRLAEADLRNIEDAIHSRLSQGSNESTDETPEIRELHLTIRAKVIIGATSPLWITLGVASLFVGIPVLAAGALGKSIRNKMGVEKYRRDRNAYLTEKSEKFLASTSKEHVRRFVTERMHLSEAMLQEFVSRMPRMLEANEKMVLQLIHETRSKEDVWSSNVPILRKSLELKNSLSKFGLLIWPETIRRDQLTWDEDEHSCIGVGEFSSVYSGILAKGDTESSENCCPISIVAVKVFKKSLDSKNAKYFMKNEAKLRELRHQNVRKFHGATVLKDFTSPDDSRIVLVMEMLGPNLRSFIFRDDFTPPANAVATESNSIVQFLQWATQITDALAYIHGLGLIHKHLQLENILVGSDESVKLSDIGVTARSEVSDRSMIYAAPEVLQTSAFSSASDVYSLGLVLWEMWYGIQVFAEIFPLDRHKFLEKIVAGYRPQKHDPKITLPKVQTIIHYCWAGRKEMRLTASRCYTNLVGELKSVEL